MDNRVRLEKAKGIIKLVINDLTNNRAPFTRKTSINNIFFNDEKLNDYFVEIFPISKSDEYQNMLYFLIKFTSASFGEDILYWSGRQYSKEQILKVLNEILDFLNASANTIGMYNIFYSWQSNTENKQNRNFIESAIENAINKIKKEFNIEIALDKDTREISGSPDIIRAILEKIDKSFMFVADVSLVAKDVERAYPNPNVELLSSDWTEISGEIGKSLP